MRAVQITRFGGPEVLEVVDIDPPEPAACEIKVRVAAASLNPLDWKIRDVHLRLVPVLARRHHIEAALVRAYHEFGARVWNEPQRAWKLTAPMAA